MTSSPNSVKQVTLEEVKKVIDALGKISEGTLHSHSLTLIVNKTGEATFTSCCWKLLNEISCSCPLSKLILNAARNYTNFCGEDCKYFLFILKEMFITIYNKINKNNELSMRKEIINEIYSLKHMLPCILKNIHDLSRSNDSNLTKDLNNVVWTFMLSRFSGYVSKILSSLVCNFIQNICESQSLLTVLPYVISHFDIFCCKILSPLSESQIIKGFLFYTKLIPLDINLEEINFIVVWDLTMKTHTKDSAWIIKDESFITQLNPVHMYKSIFAYFKSQGIKLIFTPTMCNKDLESLCKENNIILLTQLEREEINHLLTSFQIYPLDSINELVETKHIGTLSCVKSLFFNKSNFLHLQCTNTERFLKAHHILLSAPCNAMWQEYYSEILNCFKMILQWLSPQINVCFEDEFIKKMLCENKMKNMQFRNSKEAKSCDTCAILKLKLQDPSGKGTQSDVGKSDVGSGLVLPPCSWELMFRTALVNIGGKSFSSIVLQAIHLAVSKSICKRVGVPFAKVKDVENVCANFIEKCCLGEIKYLEPVVCKEIMINSILDLILQLLKIDSIVYVK